MIRLAEPGDEPAIERFLLDRAESSMFLRSNLRAAGLVDRGEALQGTWALALEGERVIGVAAFNWNGMLLVQAPVALVGALARAAVAAVPGRAITGLSGPAEQVERARHELGLAAAASPTDVEDLFALELDRLVVPAPLRERPVRCRRTEERDLARCTAWRVEYLIECFGLARSDALAIRARQDIEHSHARRDAFVLEAGEDRDIVAYSAFNARLPDIVQIGGVWTPVELRSRGFARAVVAGSLEIARTEGVARAVLFTGRENHPAQRAYAALGFRVVGAYGLVILH